MTEDKVSIITPSYNSEKFIESMIMSVQKQTYQNWELIITDDCSSDNSAAIIEKYAGEDPRIVLLKLKKNQGAAKARNCSLKRASGRYIAYLDADDRWKPDKLKNQIEFMKNKPCSFSCTSYEVISENGERLNKTVHMLPEVDYSGFLANNLLQTVGIMVDTEYIDKNTLIMPDLKRRQDAATWLKVLKSGHPCYGLREVLAEYRRVNNSLSSNKLQSVMGVLKLYREVEHLSLPLSCYYFIRYALLAVWKRIYL